MTDPGPARSTAHPVQLAGDVATLNPPPDRMIVAGAGGALGSAVVEQLLGLARVPRVGVLVARRVAAATRGVAPLADDDAAWQRFAPEAAVIVFDRTRHANGRDDAFVQPAPASMLALARRLRLAGASTLIVAVPYAPSLLPAALQRGLATLDEGAVAAIGFRQLVFMRVAQVGGENGAAASLPQRLARWMLRQLHWMVPQREQPLRAIDVARLVALLAVGLRGAPPATRVLAPEVAWAAARGNTEAALAAWLAGQPIPEVAAVRQRW